LGQRIRSVGTIDKYICQELTLVARNRSKDLLWNPELAIPPRPTISNVQWISGTQYVTPSDIDMLSKFSLPTVPCPRISHGPVGGPDRPPSKRMIEQTRLDSQAQRQAGSSRAGVAAGAAAGAAAGSADEGYWAYMQRQITERTEKLGSLSDNVGKLEDASSSWAEEASKYVKKTKQNLVMGAVKSKFGI
jgi:syntaxin-binding protein 5